MNEPRLELRGVTRTYQNGDKRLEVLKGVDLQVAPGELLALVGPSGSGKSSLLHAAGLLERPTSGLVLIEGRDCGALAERQRTRLRLEAIGFVYQFHHLLPEYSALENVVLPGLIAGLGRREAQKRATELLTYLRLSNRLDHQPAQLSGGEQQRVAVARALVNGPRLLLADEPTGNLDAQSAQDVFKSLKSLVRGTGVAGVIATHNIEMAHDMDRVLMIKDGRLVDLV